MSAYLKIMRNFPHVRNLTKLKLVLLISFSILLLFQFLVGFRDFEDYLVVFIFVLFLNDLYFKVTKPAHFVLHEERLTRLLMSGVFLVLFSLPFIFDSFNVSNAIRLAIYKLGFVLWAQVFLLDSFLHYKQTHSKQWLVFANTAVLMIIMGAFVN
ncbi:MAG: hypothetical protein ACXVLQ_13945 [Bacteriovorax sp.]